MTWRCGKRRLKSFLSVVSAFKKGRWLFDGGPLQQPIPPRLLGEMTLRGLVKKMDAGHLFEASED